MCEWADHTVLYYSLARAEADADGDIVPQPLYAAPQPAKRWLTAEQREMIGIARNHFEGNHLQQLVDACTDLLARSSPPEVVQPAVNRAAAPAYVEIVERRDAEWLAALAAAGVTVKEVGCE